MTVPTSPTRATAAAVARDADRVTAGQESPLVVAAKRLARVPVVWTAPCPHGRDMDWTAEREDTRAVITCPCTCPEEAA